MYDRPRARVSDRSGRAGTPRAWPARYTFEPGARTNWHSHEGGQVIYIEQGRLRVQEKGKPTREFDPGATFHTDPGVTHWHGALPSGTLTQVSLSFGTTTWMDRVSDADYARR